MGMHYWRTYLTDILETIRLANPGRSIANIERRSLKLGEEVGEVQQAVLAVTSDTNLKQKTWEDVLEECADVIIVASDIALTQFPDAQLTDQQRKQQLVEMIDRKLAKWAGKRDIMVEKTGKFQDCT